MAQTVREYRRYDATDRARIWDVANRGYARLSLERETQLSRLIARSLPHKSATLLDVGCGEGGLAKTLASFDPDVRYVGVDLRDDAVARARLMAPQLEFFAASADDLPFEDGIFDVAVAATLFSSIPSSTIERDAAREIARVLRPAGWLIWYDLRYGNPRNRAVHGISAQRLAELFPGWKRELQTFTVAPPLARRLGLLTPVAYPILHTVPIVRTHLLGRLQCPS